MSEYENDSANLKSRIITGLISFLILITLSFCLIRYHDTIMPKKQTPVIGRRIERFFSFMDGGR